MVRFSFKIFFTFGLFFESHKAFGFIENQERVTLAVQQRQDVHKHSPTKTESCNGWEKGINECYTESAKVAGRFPGPTFSVGATIITSFKSYTDDLASLAKSNSTFLSTRCTSTLEALSLLAKLGKTPSYLLFQYGKALPKKSSAFRSIVTDLYDSIGQLVDPFNEVITTMEDLILKTLKQFQNRFVERKHERCEKIDFEEIIKCAQLFTNTVALIAETALNNCGCVTFANEAYESIAILVFILNIYLLEVQGTNALIATVLYSEAENISPFVSSSFISMDPLIVGIAKAISSITMEVAKSMREFLSEFVNLTYSLNESLVELLGPFEGGKITVAQINKNLKKSQGN